MNKLIMLALVATLVSCGDKKGTVNKTRPQGLPETLELGVSTGHDVEKELGEPTNIYTVEEASSSASNKEATMYNYKDNQTFKLASGVMKAYFRDPQKDEIHLQFWLQKWKDKKTREEEISGSANAHGKGDFQLVSEDDSTTIIYNKENGIVKRVMYYEK